MELLNFSLKNKDAESFARLILANSLNANTFIQVLDENPNWIEDNINGEISHPTLMEIVRAGYRDQKYGILLTHIIELVDGKEIDDLIFRKMFFYPYEDIRQRLLISLAHKKLTENQLRQLCNEAISFECYYELAILYYTKIEYNQERLEKFVEEVAKSKYSYILEDMVKELVECHIASDKMKYEYILGAVDKYS